LDVLARSSYRLSLSDIAKVCDMVIDRRIGKEPNLRKHNPRSGFSYIEIQTADFINWINKYRNADPATQNEIEKFYQNSEIYARGSLPYSQSSTTEEKVEQEFSSLIIKNNLRGFPKRWRPGQNREITFSFRNLSEFNSFTGKITAETNTGQPPVIGREDELPPGYSSHEYNLSIKPKTSGILEIKFTIDGEFHLRGSETILVENTAILRGKTIHTDKFRIK